jgi:hypothetical protein
LFQTFRKIVEEISFLDFGSSPNRKPEQIQQNKILIRLNCLLVSPKRLTIRKKIETQTMFVSVNVSQRLVAIIEIVSANKLINIFCFIYIFCIVNILLYNFTNN